MPVIRIRLLIAPVGQFYSNRSFGLPDCICFIITNMAYWKIFDVTYECKESTFIEDKFSGYSTDWIRYGCSELTKPLSILSTQSLFVMKKVDFMLSYYRPIMSIKFYECRMVNWSKDLVYITFLEQQIMQQ